MSEIGCWTSQHCWNTMFSSGIRATDLPSCRQGKHGRDEEIAVLQEVLRLTWQVWSNTPSSGNIAETKGGCSTSPGGVSTESQCGGHGKSCVSTESQCGGHGKSYIFVGTNLDLVVDGTMSTNSHTQGGNATSVWPKFLSFPCLYVTLYVASLLSCTHQA